MQDGDSQPQQDPKVKEYDAADDESNVPPIPLTTWGAGQDAWSSGQAITDWGGGGDIADAWKPRPDDTPVESLPIEDNTVIKNRFVDYLGTSPLEHWPRLGYPVMALGTEFRAVNGMLDLVFEIFYPSFTVEYSRMCCLEFHQWAVDLDKMFMTLFPGLSPSPPGKLWPVLLNVPNSTTEQSTTKSKYNEKQLQVGMYKQSSLFNYSYLCIC